MQYGSEVLNDFIAPHLSKLGKCDLPDVSELPNYRSSLILRHIFLGIGYPDKLRIPISSFIVRLRDAIIEYRLASDHLRIYLAALPDHGKLGAHARAVAHFENCVLRTHLAAKMLSAIGGHLTAPRLWSKRDGSILARIHEMANRIKHFDEDITKAASSGAALPLAPIWLTDQGLESEPCKVRFEELAHVLREMSEDAENFAEKWPDAAAEKRKSALGSAPQPASATATNQSLQAPATEEPVVTQGTIDSTDANCG